MNLREMAENYVDPLSADFDCIPYSPIFLNELEAAYKAGARAVLDKVRPVLEKIEDGSAIDCDCWLKAKVLLEELKDE